VPLPHLPPLIPPLPSASANQEESGGGTVGVVIGLIAAIVCGMLGLWYARKRWMAPTLEPAHEIPTASVQMKYSKAQVCIQEKSASPPAVRQVITC
jgi:hypothetical protein